MTNVVAVSLLIEVKKCGDSKLTSYETLRTSILAPTCGLHSWAEEELSRLFPLYLEAHYLNFPEPPGIYNVLGLFKLTAGKSACTPDSPGEGWTEMELISDMHVTPVTDEIRNVSPSYNYVKDAATDLILMANVHGLVITINTVPNKPLAMGNYHMHVDIRKKDRAE